MFRMTSAHIKLVRLISCSLLAYWLWTLNGLDFTQKYTYFILFMWMILLLTWWPRKMGLWLQVVGRNPVERFFKNIKALKTKTIYTKKGLERELTKIKNGKGSSYRLIHPKVSDKLRAINLIEKESFESKLCKKLDLEPEKMYLMLFDAPFARLQEKTLFADRAGYNEEQQIQLIADTISGLEDNTWVGVENQLSFTTINSSSRIAKALKSNPLPANQYLGVTYQHFYLKTKGKKLRKELKRIEKMPINTAEILVALLEDHYQNASEEATTKLKGWMPVFTVKRSAFSKLYKTAKLLS